MCKNEKIDKIYKQHPKNKAYLKVVVFICSFLIFFQWVFLDIY
jgi:hypothetical protein